MDAGGARRGSQQQAGAEYNSITQSVVLGRLPTHHKATSAPTASSPASSRALAPAHDAALVVLLFVLVLGVVFVSKYRVQEAATSELQGRAVAVYVSRCVPLQNQTRHAAKRIQTGHIWPHLPAGSCCSLVAEHWLAVGHLMMRSEGSKQVRTSKSILRAEEGDRQRATHNEYTCSAQPACLLRARRAILF